MIRGHIDEDDCVPVWQRILGAYPNPNPNPNPNPDPDPDPNPNPNPNPGIPAAALVTPADVIKTRLQVPRDGWGRISFGQGLKSGLGMRIGIG